MPHKLFFQVVDVTAEINSIFTIKILSHGFLGIVEVKKLVGSYRSSDINGVFRKFIRIQKRRKPQVQRIV